MDWDAPDAPTAAFAAYLMHRGDRPLTENGLRFAVETLRLLWQDDAHVRCGLPAARAVAAACLRVGEDSGFFLSGALLAERCQKKTEIADVRVIMMLGVGFCYRRCAEPPRAAGATRENSPQRRVQP